MSDSEIRDWYLRKIAAIPDLDVEWVKSGATLEERARRAWKIRHDARLEARSMMKHPVEVALIRARDRLLYGNPEGPSFEYLVKAGRRDGLTSEQTFRRILEGAQVTNRAVDRVVLGRKPKRKR